MDKGVKSLAKSKDLPAIQPKDPFAHWHPRHERAMLREHFKDVPIEQIKEVAAGLKLSGSKEVVAVP